MDALVSDKQEKSLLHFARFEFKYILSKQQRDDVEAHLVNFLEYDPFVQSKPEHKYTVRSLYYDDPRYGAFHDKIDGLHTRSKFRVRTYGKDFSEKRHFFSKLKEDIIIWFLNIGRRLILALATGHFYAAMHLRRRFWEMEPPVRCSTSSSSEF